MTIGAVPQLLKHQGFTSDSQGTPLNGSANAIFNLYAEETDGESIWTQTVSLTFDNGYYSITLGPGTPELSIEIFDGSELYLGMTLEGQTEFSPRMKIGSMPYAFRAKAVEGEVKAVGGLVVDGVEVIDSDQQWTGNNISFNDLEDIPSDLADGDDVGLEGSGTGGTLAKFTESGLGDSLMVESDGNIGVGTDDPQSTVQIAGGLQIEDDTGDCVSGKEGTLRWHENKIEVCDGNSWGAISSGSIGHSQGQAGLSCKTILDSGSSQGDGTYWIDLDGSGGDDPFEAYCDMTTDGGGWTRMAKFTNTSYNIVGSTYTNGFGQPLDDDYVIQCSKFSNYDPNNVFMRIKMGDVTDFYKPTGGAPLCQMLSESPGRHHQWSNTHNGNYVTPSYYGGHLGGCANGWPSDGRNYISFWGGGGSNSGCCHYTFSDGGAWSRAFTIDLREP